MVHIVEIQKLFPRIPNSNQFPETVENQIFKFCVGFRVGELLTLSIPHQANFHVDQKMHKNIPHLLIPVAGRGKILRGFK